MLDGRGLQPRIAYEFSERPTQSRAELVKLTKASPKNGQYYYLLGRVDRQNQHLEDAIADFRKAIELDQGYMRTYEELGQCQESLGLTEDARKTYELAAFRNRYQRVHWAWSPLDYGVFLLKTNDMGQAEKLIRESLQYNPRFGWAHYYMGQLLQKQGKDKEAIGEYQEAVVDDPKHRQAWLALGREYTRLGRKPEAAKALAMFQKLNSQEEAIKHKSP